MNSAQNFAKPREQRESSVLEDERGGRGGPGDDTNDINDSTGGNGNHRYSIASLPTYLRQLISDILLDDEQQQHALTEPSNTNNNGNPTTATLPLAQIRTLSSSASQYAHLLLRRHHLTTRLASIGLAPQLLLERARVYEALAYPELAVGDALVAFTVCEYEEDGGGDLRGVWNGGGDELGMGDGDVAESEDRGGDGDGEVDEELEQDDDDAIDDETQNQKLIEKVKVGSAGVVARSLRRLRPEKAEVERWEGVWRGLASDAEEKEEQEDDDDDDDDDEAQRWCIFPDDAHIEAETTGAFVTGASRREIYPWNELEGDRMSNAALQEINARLEVASDGMLRVQKSMLPTLSSATSSSVPAACQPLDLPDATASQLNIRATSEPNKTTTATEIENAQLGLFATRPLPPHTTILTERSALTAIRPHGAALCDACAGDLETVSSSSSASSSAGGGDGTNRRSPQTCPGCGIPFCSPECLAVAMKTYHTPNEDDEETDEGFPPATAPFCPGASGGIPDIANLGRAESSRTPEWDLYFLLVVRALQMAETLGCHPLQVWECRWIWGDFNPVPELSSSSSSSKIKIKRSLPFSLRHHVELPLQWFELLMLSRQESAPYTPKWLERYDWWVIQTLYAKFRGVADANLSSWSGEPETASVYPLWCLANHSCEASVTWEGGGVRRLVVRGERVVESEGTQWMGIGTGEEVWNHYTDVREKDYRVRRQRLVEVLGGECRCSRCLREEAEELASNGS